MRTEISDLLKECRMRKGLSQDQLAYRINVDQAIVSKVENGKIQPSYALVKQWAKVTDSKDLLAAHMAGEDWKKQYKLESTISQMKNLLNAVNFMRIKKN